MYRKVIEDYDIIPFNIGFALDIWLVVIRNIEANVVHTLGIEGDAVKLVHSIFDFYSENDDPYSHGKSPVMIFTLHGDKVAWLVHPVEEIYGLH